MSRLVFCFSFQYQTHQSFINLPYDNHSEFYQQTLTKSHQQPEEKCSLPNLSRTSSPVLVYLENKNLALCASITCLLLLLLVGLGIFLFDKLSQPIILDDSTSTMNMSHENLIVVSSLSTHPSTSPFSQFDQITTETRTTTPIESSTLDFTICPKDTWGLQCQHICKPCGLGFCHSKTGECICPTDIYGEFCDLWKGKSF